LESERCGEFPGSRQSSDRQTRQTRPRDRETERQTDQTDRQRDRRTNLRDEVDHLLRISKVFRVPGFQTNHAHTSKHTDRDREIARHRETHRQTHANRERQTFVTRSIIFFASARCSVSPVSRLMTRQ
jgi:hypothetical protein